jgi:lipopolysaccharide export system ATP-binding protein
LKNSGKVVPINKTVKKPIEAPLINKGLAAEHLGKRYKRRPVVHDVSFTLRRGEVVGLLGPNGAGKTTCFYLVTGLVKPDTGTIRLDGIDVTSFPMYRRARLGLGYLPQESSIFRGLTVEENIRAVLEVVEMTMARAKQCSMSCWRNLA